jgi:tRNA threonylcarbamoyl adenosine modification protein YeaZ/ribosomal-protein-alanine acetyltransferase
MLILALETVTARGSVATCEDGRVEGRVGSIERTHGERLPGEITEWLATRGRQLADVDVFAVISGPGSFTGLRVGMAAIQGLALAGQRSAVAVPTLDAIVEGWLVAGTPNADVIVPCLDGQRGEIFAAAVDAAGARTVDDTTGLIPPTAARPDALADLVASRFAACRLTVVGTDVQRYAGAFRRALPAATLVDVPMSLAEAAARIAYRRPDRAVRPHALQPIYVRRPDAVLVRERASGGSGHPTHAVRRATTAEDLSEVDALQRQTFTNPWGAEAIKWELENTDVSRLYVMHDHENKLVAYCACWMVFDELHINSLAVDVACRRRGHARRLLGHVLREAVAAGARAATLEVRSSNEAARALYEGLGFAVEGVRRDYYQDPREDAVILWKRHL